MSKSLRRVEAALSAAGVSVQVLEMGDETRTAAQAAAAAGCALDQIVKSILFQGAQSGQLHLFLTAGGVQVSADKAAALVGEPVTRADAAMVRAQTGFAIGGVAPLGHLTPVVPFMDPALMGYAVVWAATGTPRHIFAIAPGVLQRITGARVTDFAA